MRHYDNGVSDGVERMGRVRAPDDTETAPGTQNAHNPEVSSGSERQHADHREDRTGGSGSPVNGGEDCGGAGRDSGRDSGIHADRDGRGVAKSGVYEIVNLVSGNAYVGSSGNIPARWASHRNALAVGCHTSKKLQEEWTSHGGEVFSFRVVAEINEDAAMRKVENDHIQRRKLEGRLLNAKEAAFPSRGWRISPGMPPKRLLTISEAAARLGVHANTLRGWADRGLVPVIKLPSGYRRFDPDVIERERQRMGLPPDTENRHPDESE